MKFSFQSLIALTTAIAILLATKRSPELLLFLVLMVMPIMMMLIAITCPKDGNQLDSSRRWYLHLLGKTWLHVICLLALLFLCSIARPYLPNKLARAMTVDFNEYEFSIPLKFDSDGSEYVSNNYKVLYDSSGYVGVIRDTTMLVGDTRFSNDSSRNTLVLTVRTNIQDAYKLQVMTHSYETKTGGRVILLD